MSRPATVRIGDNYSTITAADNHAAQTIRWCYRVMRRGGMHPTVARALLVSLLLQQTIHTPLAVAA